MLQIYLLKFQASESYVRNYLAFKRHLISGSSKMVYRTKVVDKEAWITKNLDSWRIFVFLYPFDWSIRLECRKHGNSRAHAIMATGIISPDIICWGLFFFQKEYFPHRMLWSQQEEAPKAAQERKPKYFCLPLWMCVWVLFFFLPLFTRAMSIMLMMMLTCQKMSFWIEKCRKRNYWHWLVSLS